MIKFENKFSGRVVSMYFVFNIIMYDVVIEVEMEFIVE